MSFCRSWLVSRRISLAIHSLSGAESHTRAETYTFVSSNMIHASVFSVAGAPSMGTCCTKSVIACTSLYTASSSSPSSLMPSASLMARTVAFPCSSRVTTAGAIGGGGPSIAASNAAPPTAAPTSATVPGAPPPGFDAAVRVGAGGAVRAGGGTAAAGGAGMGAVTPLAARVGDVPAAPGGGSNSATPTRSCRSKRSSSAPSNFAERTTVPVATSTNRPVIRISSLSRW